MKRILILLLYSTCFHCLDSDYLPKSAEETNALEKKVTKFDVVKRRTEHELMKYHRPSPEAAIVVRRNYKRDFIVGIDEFNDLIFEAGVYVDKTLLIKDFIEDNNQVYMVNLPRRWGKSINLDMLKTFFNIPLDHNYETIKDIQTAPNYRLFVKREVRNRFKKIRLLKDHFLISQHQRIIDNFLGRYPVIHVRFKPTGTLGNFTTYLLEFRSQISEAYKKHFHVVNKWYFAFLDEQNDNLTRNEAVKRFKRFMNHAFLMNNTIPSEEVEKSVYYLSKTLYAYYKRKVIILLDDYYEPWKSILYDAKISKKDRIRFLIFYTNFMEKTLRGNRYLEKAMIVGSLPPPEELRLTVFKQTAECSFLTGKFMEHYGINQWELKGLMEHLEILQDAYVRINELYNGYKANHKSLEIHNIWSITAFFASSSTKNDWVYTAKADYLMSNAFKLSTFRDKFATLIEKNKITITVPRRYYTWLEYAPLLKAISDRSELTEDFTDRIFWFLFHTGYLTLAKNVDLRTNTTTFHLKVPNGELRQHFQGMVYKLKLALEHSAKAALQRAKWDQLRALKKERKRNGTYLTWKNLTKDQLLIAIRKSSIKSISLKKKPTEESGEMGNKKLHRVDDRKKLLKSHKRSDENVRRDDFTSEEDRRSKKQRHVDDGRKLQKSDTWSEEKARRDKFRSQDNWKYKKQEEFDDRRKSQKSDTWSEERGRNRGNYRPQGGRKYKK